MRLETLGYLVDIAETHSINATAGRLFVSQQNISRAIKSLETELQCQLLERSYTGVSLTAEGAVLVDKAQLILNLMASVKEDLHTLQPREESDLTGRLRVRANHQANHTVMAEIVARFVKEHPHVTLSISASAVPEIPGALERGEADVALAGYSPHAFAANTPRSEVLAQLARHRLCADSVMICLSRELGLGQRSFLRPSDIWDVPQISMGAQSLINEVIFRGTQKPFLLVEASTKEQFKQTIAAGLGFGLSSTLDMKLNYTKDERERLAFLPLVDDQNDIVYEILCMPGQEVDPLVAAFMETVELFFKIHA